MTRIVVNLTTNSSRLGPTRDRRGDVAEAARMLREYADLLESSHGALGVDIFAPAGVALGSDTVMRVSN